MITKPNIEPRPEQHYVAIRTALPIPFGKYIQPAWDEVQQWLKSRGVSSPGPAIIRYLTTDMSQKLDIEIGFALDKALPGDNRITAGVLPAGRYATLLYTGPYRGKGMYKTNVAMMEWAKENNVAWNVTIKNGVEWWNGRTEFYLTDPATEPDTKKYRAELAIMVK